MNYTHIAIAIIAGILLATFVPTIPNTIKSVL